MTRRRFVQDRATGQLREVSNDYLGDIRGPGGMIIMDDIPPFISPIDGREITGRRALREHNLTHDVTNVADFTETWKKAEANREKLRNGTFDSRSMRESLINAYDQGERNGR